MRRCRDTQLVLDLAQGARNSHTAIAPAQLLQALEAAWVQGSQSQLQNAINIMFNLQPAAQTILKMQMPDGTFYGPTFDVNDVPSA